MPHAKAEDEVAALLRRREQLDTKLKAAQERRKEQERLQHEKRKLLAGEIVLDFMAANPADPLTSRLSELLDRELSRPTDRALFPALSQSGEPENKSPSPG